MQKKLLFFKDFLYNTPMSDKIQIPFSAAKLLIKICRPAFLAEGTEDSLYPDEWAVHCEPCEARSILIKLGLITCFAWRNENQFIPTGKGMNLYVEG